MGMDVYGKEPTSETGKYFRNNVWGWRPLWDYVSDIGASVISDELHRAGHHNDGAGLDAAGSLHLAQLLRAELDNGRTANYAAARQAALDALPLHDCPWCNGTGVRTDVVGVRNGMLERINPHTGKPGWCNGCDGKGKVNDDATSYGFSVENVEEFTVFLEHCGGFRIC